MDAAAGDEDLPIAPPVTADGEPIVAMVVDVLSTRTRWILTIVALSILCFMLLIGFLGPATFDSGTSLFTQCGANGTANAASNSSNCYTALLPNTTFEETYSGLSRINQFFMMTVTFTSSDSVARSFNNFLFDVNLAYRRAGSSTWKSLRTNDVGGEQISCNGGSTNVCSETVVVLELFILGPAYDIVLSMPNSVQDMSWINSVLFTIYSVNGPYTIMTIVVRTIYFALTLILGLLFMRRLSLHRTWSGKTWTSEQRWTLVLLFSFLLYCNPFLPYDFSSYDLFTNLLISFNAVQFECLLTLYMLLFFDLIRKNFRLESPAAFYALRTAVVCTLAFLLFLGVVIFNVQAASNPVARWNNSMAFATFTFIASALWVLLLIYLVVVIIWAGTTVREFPQQTQRYSYAAMVFGPYAICIAIATLTSTYRPRDATGFLFFTTIRLLIIFACVVGYWPLGAGSTIGFAPVLQDERMARASLLAAASPEAAPILDVTENDPRARRFYSDSNPFA